MADIQRQDKYRILVNGKTIVATKAQEAQLRTLDDDQIESFLKVMGKGDFEEEGIIARESRWALRIDGKVIQATPEQKDKIRRLEAEFMRKFVEVMTGEKYVQRGE